MNIQGDTSRPSGSSRTTQIGARRRARELCLALIFAADVGRQTPGQLFAQADGILQVLIEQWELDHHEADRLKGEIEQYGRRLAEQYFAHAKQIDDLISRYSEGWALSRMPAVDRSILRMALAEMQHMPGVPVGVTIDEAVELAKEYGTEESGKFINGILGAVARELAETSPAVQADEATDDRPEPTAAPC